MRKTIHNQGEATLANQTFLESNWSVQPVHELLFPNPNNWNDCGLKGNFQEPIMTDEKKKHVDVKSISHRAEAERHPQASLSLLQLWHMGFNVCNTKSSKKGEKPLLHLKKREMPTMYTAVSSHNWKSRYQNKCLECYLRSIILFSYC